jgi:anti-anti-sigma factor
VTDTAPRVDPAGALEVRSSTEPGGIILSLGGELDLSTAPEVERELVAALGRRPVRVVLDLSRLAFMDSTGLGLIVRAEHDMREAGVGLCVRGGSAQVRRLFEVTGVGERLTLEE